MSLFLGDLICLSVFVLLGMRTHETLAGAHPAVRFALNALPLMAAWAAAGASLQAFRFARPARLRTVLGRTLAAWLIAAPLGLIVRALLLRSAVLPVIFVLVTLGVGGGLLLAWRAAYAALVLRRGTQPRGGVAG